MRRIMGMAAILAILTASLTMGAAAKELLSDDFSADVKSNQAWAVVRNAASTNGQVVLTGDPANWMDSKIYSWSPYPFADGTLFQTDIVGFDVKEAGSGFDLLGQIWVTPTPEAEAYYNIGAPSISIIFHYKKDSPETLVVIWKKNSGEFGSNGTALWEGTVPSTYPIRVGLWLNATDYKVTFSVPATTKTGSLEGKHGFNMSEWPDGGHFHLTTINFDSGRGSTLFDNALIRSDK